MEHASAELSGTVIVIILLAFIVGLGTWLFGDNGVGKTWINSVFQNRIGSQYGG